jgi:hypothetical protein
MTWAKVNLHGAKSIARVCGVYEIHDFLRIPEGKFKIKVLQRGPDEYVAYPNICVRSPAGIPGWTSGMGRSEEEALEDALKALAADLDALRGSLERERFEWSDPTDF